MKLRIRNIFITVALGSLASCSDNTPDTPREKDTITFSSPVVAEISESRAGFVQSSLPEGSTYTVYGYCIPVSSDAQPVTDSSFNPAGAQKSWKDKSSLSYPEVMMGSVMKIDNSKPVYTSAPAEWYTKSNAKVRNEADPAGFTYTFLAFAPSSERFIVESGVGANRLTYKVEYPCSEDAMYAFVADHKRADGNVPLQFHHLLSGLSVRLNNYNSETITVNSLTLSGSFYNEANVDYSGMTPIAAAGSTTADAVECKYVTAPVTVEGESASTLKESFFVLPNPASAAGNYLGSGKVITGTFTYRGQSIDFRIPSEGDNFDFNRIPKPGVNYILNINFTGSETKLIISTGDEWWEIGSDSNLSFN